ncbi:MAG: fasciclin domain-containing protein [Nannocystaceae bacterium]
MRNSTFIVPLALCFALGLGCDDKKEEKKDDARANANADAKKDEAKADAKPAEAAKPADAAPAADAAGAKDIVATAKAAGTFTTLQTALDKAGLTETLQGDGPFTVFAPTDDAFAKVDKAALDALLAKPDELKKVLLMHVVKGKVMAADASKLTEAKVMSGDTLKVDASDGVKLGDAKVTKADIEASNGVIHVIDTVILPAS